MDKAEKKYYYSEIFYSIQGEGRFAGVPSVFLRTFGCNFQCRGFGMARGERTTEPEKIAENVVNTQVNSKRSADVISFTTVYDSL